MPIDKLNGNRTKRSIHTSWTNIWILIHAPNFHSFVCADKAAHISKWNELQFGENRLHPVLKSNRMSFESVWHERVQCTLLIRPTEWKYMEFKLCKFHKIIYEWSSRAENAIQHAVILLYLKCTWHSHSSHFIRSWGWIPRNCCTYHAIT